MFDNKSRYHRQQQYMVTDKRGRKVIVVGSAPPPLQFLAGYHLLQQGQRTDHLAAQYLNLASGFWRIAEINDAMLPEAISEKNEIAIPVK
ncbi:MAG: hypothetical protein IPG86_19915 [Chitinophagaceae bacterium]|nr:hypothetical protein [Chitinophagaceae bacterium]